MTVEAKVQIGDKSKTVGWYAKYPPDIKPAAKDLLIKYAGVPEDQISDYVLTMRDKAWDIFPYPCIGSYRFLDLSLMRLPVYPRLLETLKSGGKLLDIGCCMAQDLRQLAFDGVPSENLYGAEIEAPFMDLGYDLFKDKDTFRAHFTQANILDTVRPPTNPESTLHSLLGAMDFVHLGMVLHVFSLEEQQLALERCIELLKPEKGVMIVGQAVGHVSGTSHASRTHHDSHSFKHSDETFRQLWKAIEEKKGIKFDCRASLDTGLGVADGKRGWDDPGARRLIFEVERLE
ncbi:hypothetical protein BX600DRAFT_514542 [Xylariales sp. PMI_506]|nr:hypothetical protein BX600DRAFT_514542 [Xylariales sp. PMI_506]